MTFFFFFNAPAPTEIYTLSLHDALPILRRGAAFLLGESLDRFDESAVLGEVFAHKARSEEHTSELQSRFDLVCRLLLEKKKIILPLIKPGDAIKTASYRVLVASTYG